MATDEPEGDEAFSRSEALGALDTIMWRGEVDPTLRSTMVGLEILDRAPDWDRLHAAHEWASRMLPRFRKKVVEGSVPWAVPRWTVDEGFDLDYHLRRTRLPEPATWETLLWAAQQAAMVPFDRARPPWEAILYEGLPDGRAAYLLKLHHATADGMGVVALLSKVHSRTREPNPDRPDRAAPAPDQPNPLGALARQAGEDLAAVPGVARSLGGAARKTITDPLGTAKGVLNYGNSMRRVLGDVGADGSPLLAKRSLAWRFGALDVGFDDLKGAAKAGGGSFNDGYLAALLGGIRRYHEAMGQPVDRIPMAIPVSIRKPDDPADTNRIASARIIGPVGLTDPAERILEVRRLIGAARKEPALEAIGVVAPVLARLPGQVVARLGGDMTKSNDLQASNVPGIRHDVYLAGAKIERVYPYAPLPGCAMMITVLTHGDTCCVAANYDAAAITDPALFMKSLVEGFAEVLTLTPGAADPVLRG